MNFHSAPLQKNSVSLRRKWVLVAVILVVLGGALVWTRKEQVPSTGARIAKPAIAAKRSSVVLPAGFAEQFDAFDKNGDGVIDKAEFVAAVSAKTGMPMALLNMARFRHKLDELYKNVLVMSKPNTVDKEGLVTQGISKGHVLKMIRRYGLKPSYDRNALRSLLRAFLNNESLKTRADVATARTSTLSPEMSMWFGYIAHKMHEKPQKTWEELQAEKGTLPRGSACGAKTGKFCGGYSCGASDKTLVKFACCKKVEAVGKFRPAHAQCGCCTKEREGVCLWDGSLVEKRNGLVRLDSVAVGDEVHVGNGDFDTVIYVEQASLVDMLNIEIAVLDDTLTNTTNLVLTWNHMIVKENGDLVVAGSLRVGDKVGCDSASKSCVVTDVSRRRKGFARSIFLLHSNHFIANGIRTSSFTDSRRVMEALLRGIINPVRWIWKTTAMSQDHPLFFLVRLANRVFSWTVDPLVRSTTWRRMAHTVFGMMTQS